MIINHTTGEIAYHCLILTETVNIEIKQYELENKEGELEFIQPKKAI